MRLLNTETLELKYFNTGEVPAYAILSHTWEDEEVTLQQLHTDAARQKRGYEKIVKFCKEARERGLHWGWADTCCIDKADLVELSQAINSMFAWYRDAAICLAYLSDFHLWEENGDWNKEDLGISRWFRRGWTLQELIAPKHLIFYDGHWRAFGTKVEIADLVSGVTSIDVSLLRGQKPSQEFSCAQKMSWAAHRETTRVEDRAYSLLGIFSISFSPVYGEGWRAFGRLQEEILKVSTDQSLFAWTQFGALDPFSAKDHIDPNDWSAPHRCSILAPTPDCFHDSSNIIGAATHPGVTGAHPLLAPHMSGYSGASSHILNNPIAVVNTGLQVSLLVQKVLQHGKRWLLEAMLNCRRESDQEIKITIFLVADTSKHPLDNSNGNVPAWRVEPHCLGSATLEKELVSPMRWFGNEASGSQPQVDRWAENCSVITFDLHPIHAVLPKSLTESKGTRLEYNKTFEKQRDAAWRRILFFEQSAEKQRLNSTVSKISQEAAPEQSTKSEPKKTAEQTNDGTTVLASVVVGIISVLSKVAVKQLDKRQSQAGSQTSRVAALQRAGKRGR